MSTHSPYPETGCKRQAAPSLEPTYSGRTISVNSELKSLLFVSFLFRQRTRFNGDVIGIERASCYVLPAAWRLRSTIEATKAKMNSYICARP